MYNAFQDCDTETAKLDPALHVEPQAINVTFAFSLRQSKVMLDAAGDYVEEKYPARMTFSAPASFLNVSVFRTSFREPATALANARIGLAKT